MMERADILRRMVEAGEKASAAIREIYEKGFHVEMKEDHSPVTDADLASDRILRENLLLEDVAFLSEEEQDDLSRLERKRLFIVDPLDGTQDFVERDGSFSVNIAYVEDGRPVLSVIALPLLRGYAYAVQGEGSFLVADGKAERLHVSDRLEGLVYLASRTHENQWEKDVVSRHRDRIASVLRLGASQKGVALASGKGDVSVRYTDKTKEWDTCAMDLLVTEAGGIFVDTKGRPFVYNRKDVYNRDGYAMFNRKENMDLLK